MQTVLTDPLSTDADRRRGLPWWLFLITGAAWLWFGSLVLSFDYRTVLAIAIFAAVSFMVAGFNELLTGVAVRRRGWAHGLLGVLFLGVGVVALAWPDITVLTLASVLAWFLLFSGGFDVVTSIMSRDDDDLWWLRLIIGVVSIGIGFWAISAPERSFTLLAVWVALAALMRGFGQFLLAFSLKSGDAALIDLTEEAAAPGPNDPVIDEFRRNHGKVGGDLAGAPLLLLHSRGARTGQERVHPLMYAEDGDDIAVFASKAGSDTNPDWYHNLLANPQASIEIGDDRYDVEARPADAAERKRLWERQKAENPQFAEYERNTSRTIPVIILHRARVAA